MYRQRHSPTHTYKQRLTLTAVVLLIPLAAACGSEKADGEQPGSGAVSAEQPVTGVRWNVDSVTVDGATHRAPAGAHVEIRDGKAAGSYGCNNFTAKAAVEGDSIRFSDARSTRMACAEQPMDFERTLAGTLAEGALSTEVDGATLTLATADGDQVLLTRK
ncbi:META domain-containing protein [Streptomyces sp. NBC_00015]|uniref:META domain-containing protein n=1 Tax=unclassified Streptomyces TaxID=2593676 RepID=UPI0022516302|nr:META domain-containing protein [Streptomyces sp. NBC_00103]MCX5369530.1 META domain-containing protein [Streptomyces sp. NBC_00103]